MNRRRFLTTSLSAAGAGALAADANAQTTPKAAPEYYELRQYHLRVTMRQRFSDHFKDEALPAYNRAGIGPIGVFTVGSPAQNSPPPRNLPRSDSCPAQPTLGSGSSLTPVSRIATTMPVPVAPKCFHTLGKYWVPESRARSPREATSFVAYIIGIASTRVTPASAATCCTCA